MSIEKINTCTQITVGVIVGLYTLILLIKEIDKISNKLDSYLRNRKMILFFKFCYWTFSIIAISLVYISTIRNDLIISMMFSYALFAIVLTLIAHILLVIKEKANDKKE